MSERKSPRERIQIEDLASVLAERSGKPPLKEVLPKEVTPNGSEDPASTRAEDLERDTGQYENGADRIAKLTLRIHGEDFTIDLVDPQGALEYLESFSRLAYDMAPRGEKEAIRQSLEYELEAIRTFFDAELREDGGTEALLGNAEFVNAVRVYLEHCAHYEGTNETERKVDSEEMHATNHEGTNEQVFSDHEQMRSEVSECRDELISLAAEKYSDDTKTWPRQLRDAVADAEVWLDAAGKPNPRNAVWENQKHILKNLNESLERVAATSTPEVASAPTQEIEHVDTGALARNAPDSENQSEHSESAPIKGLVLDLEGRGVEGRALKREEARKQLLEYKSDAVNALKAATGQTLKETPEWKPVQRKIMQIQKLIKSHESIDNDSDLNDRAKGRRRKAIEEQIASQITELEELRLALPGSEEVLERAPILVEEGGGSESQQEGERPSVDAPAGSSGEGEPENAAGASPEYGVPQSLAENYGINLEQIRAERAPIEALKAEVREKEKVYQDLVRQREAARSALPLVRWFNGERHLEKKMQQAHDEYIDAYQRRAIAGKERISTLYVEKKPEKEEAIMGRLRASVASFSRDRYRRIEDIRDEAALAAEEKSAVIQLKKWYASLSPERKILMRSAIGGAAGFAAVAAGITGAGALGLVGYTGYRAFRSGVGALATVGAVSTVGAAWQQLGLSERAQKKSHEVEEGAHKSFNIDNIAAYEAALARSKYILTKDKKWLGRWQMATAMAVGGTTAALSFEYGPSGTDLTPGRALSDRISTEVNDLSKSLGDMNEAIGEKFEGISDQVQEYFSEDAPEHGTVTDPEAEASAAQLNEVEDAKISTDPSGDPVQQYADTEYLAERQRILEAGLRSEVGAFQELHDMIDGPEPIDIEVKSGDTLTEILRAQVEKEYSYFTNAQKHIIVDHLIEEAHRLEKMGSLEELTGIEHPDRIDAGEHINIGPLMQDSAIKPALWEVKGMYVDEQAAYMARQGLDFDGKPLDVTMHEPAPEKPPIYTEGYLPGDVQVEELAPPAGAEASQVPIDPEKTTPYVVRDPDGRTAYVVAGGNAHDKLVMATELAKKTNMGVLVPAETFWGNDQVVTPNGERLVVSSTAGPGEDLPRNVISKDQVPSFDDMKPHIIGKVKM
jgi:hypothetical protein